MYLISCVRLKSLTSCQTLLKMISKLLEDTLIKASCALIAVQLDSTGLPMDCYRPDDCSVRVVCVQTDMWTVQDRRHG